MPAPPSVARVGIDGPADLVELSRDQIRGVLESLGTSEEGLTAAEAEARLARFGLNDLPRLRGVSPARQLAAQFVHFFALMLWVASAFAFIGGMPQLGWAIIAVVLVNGAFAFVQEYRADRATRALSALLPQTARVVRDRRKQTVPAEMLVPGDVLVLSEGDRVSADARVFSAEGLKLDNSMLTGESEPVERSAERSKIDEPPTDAPNLVFAGTYVTSGVGLAAVAATGARTKLGALSRITGEVVRRPTPLRIELTRLVRIVSALAVAAGFGFFGVSVMLGTPARDGFLFAVGVIVALVPEGLLPTLTLSMALSAKRMAQRRALVRRLEAVETLGATTVICTDKTGTITANQMTARAVAVAGRRIEVSGSGYDPAGTLLIDGRPLDHFELASVEHLLDAAALCADARIEQSEGRHRCAGDPTEGGLIVLAAKGGTDRTGLERRAPRVREFPFDSKRRLMSTVHALSSGSFEVFVKGAPEVVLGVATSLSDGGVSRPLDVDAQARIATDIEFLAGKGLRILALARKELADAPASASEAERDLEFLGLVGLEDPVRPEVPEAIARCRDAGIRIVMVTGDHPATAAAVARKAGFPSTRPLIGTELPAEDSALAALLIEPVTVISRVEPEQKLRIARTLQQRGDVVAMTGDGVNDAPALRQADIGVAMGKSGTDVAREAADLILLDDNFAHIVEAVEEGRAAFDNIKRFLTYHLTDNVAELAPFLAWALSARSIPLALSVLQILALDIGTDLLPALALGAERPESGTMSKPPRARTSRLIDRRIVGRAFGFLGPVQAVLSLAMLPLGAWLFFGWQPGQALPADGGRLAVLSTMVFASIVVMQMANAFECRSTPASLLSIKPFSNPLLTGAVAIESLMLVAFVYFPPLRRALDQHALSWREWLPVLATPWLFLAAEEARKALARHRARASSAGSSST